MVPAVALFIVEEERAERGREAEDILKKTTAKYEEKRFLKVRFSYFI